MYGIVHAFRTTFVRCVLLGAAFQMCVHLTCLIVLRFAAYPHQQQLCSYLLTLIFAQHHQRCEALPLRLSTNAAAARQMSIRDKRLYVGGNLPTQLEDIAVFFENCFDEIAEQSQKTYPNLAPIMTSMADKREYCDDKMDVSLCLLSRKTKGVKGAAPPKKRKQ
jgi:hypothetical protein